MQRTTRCRTLPPSLQSMLRRSGRRAATTRSCRPLTLTTFALGHSMRSLPLPPPCHPLLPPPLPLLLLCSSLTCRTLTSLRSSRAKVGCSCHVAAGDRVTKICSAPWLLLDSSRRNRRKRKEEVDDDDDDDVLAPLHADDRDRPGTTTQRRQRQRQRRPTLRQQRSAKRATLSLSLHHRCQRWSASVCVPAWAATATPAAASLTAAATLTAAICSTQGR